VNGAHCVHTAAVLLLLLTTAVTLYHVTTTIHVDWSTADY